MAKMAKKSVAKVQEGECTSVFGEEIHSDLWGPASTATLGGWHYYMSFTDDWSKWTVVCLLRWKSKAFKAFKDFYAWVLTQLEKHVKCLHTD